MTAPANPHTRPTVASIVAAVVGVLTVVQAFFTSGHLPSSAEVASILGGTGLTLGSVTAFLYSHLGITRAQFDHDIAVGKGDLMQLEPILGTIQSVPGIEEHVKTLEASLAAKFDELVAKLPQPVQVDLDKLAQVVKDKIVAGAVTPNPPGTPIPGASPTPVADPSTGQGS